MKMAKLYTKKVKNLSYVEAVECIEKFIDVTPNYILIKNPQGQAVIRQNNFDHTYEAEIAMVMPD